MTLTPAPPEAQNPALGFAAVIPVGLPHSSLPPRAGVSLSTSAHPTAGLGSAEPWEWGVEGRLYSHWGWEKVGGGLGPFSHRRRHTDPKQCSAFY